MVGKKVRLLWFILLLALLASCAGPRKAQLESGPDPVAAIDEVTRMLQQLRRDQVDLLANEEYTQGRVYLAKAKQALKDQDPAEEAVENASIAKAFFQDADKLAKSREPMAQRILEARMAALVAGARSHRTLIDDMLEIDDDLRGTTKRFSRSLSPEDFSTYQRRYLDLEVQAVQFKELTLAKQAITKAVDEDAEELAPDTCRTAKLDYETAMNMIAQSPRNPENYRKSVESALVSVIQLVDVMEVIKGAEGTPEKSAVQIVNQKRALGELSSNMGQLKASLESAKQTLQQKETELQRTEGVLKSQEEQLALASTQVRFQKAMDEAQRVIPPDDALVYQQGNKLVFRLKRINFPSGTAVIPESSKVLLARVNKIIQDLDAKMVTVQGHTDSIGPAEVNQKLSTDRATAVANYLVSLQAGYNIQFFGYGESHPIAPNETPEGRAMNRRVDLVVSVNQ